MIKNNVLPINQYAYYRGPMKAEEKKHEVELGYLTTMMEYAEKMNMTIGLNQKEIKELADKINKTVEDGVHPMMSSGMAIQTVNLLLMQQMMESQERMDEFKNQVDNLKHNKKPPVKSQQENKNATIMQRLFDHI